MSSLSKQIEKQNGKYKLDDLTIKYINVHGLANNYIQIEIIAATEKPDFLILSETHLTKDIGEQEITIQGYDNIGSVPTSSSTGGVII